MSAESRQLIEDVLLRSGGPAGGGAGVAGTSVAAAAAALASDDPAVAAVVRRLGAMGFAPSDARAAAVATAGAPLGAAVERLCLTLDDAELPPAFAPTPDVEVVRFGAGGVTSAAAAAADGALLAALAGALATSRANAERAVRSAGGVPTAALALLYRRLVGAVGGEGGGGDGGAAAAAVAAAAAAAAAVAGSDAAAALAEERDGELAALSAIYGDACVEVGAGDLAPWFPTVGDVGIPPSTSAPGVRPVFALTVHLPAGLPALGIHPTAVAAAVGDCGDGGDVAATAPAALVLIDAAGTYPATPPVVYLRAPRAPAAARRAATRAAAAHTRGLYAASGDASAAGTPIVHELLTFLAGATEEELMAAAATTQRAVIATATATAVASAADGAAASGRGGGKAGAVAPAGGGARGGGGGRRAGGGGGGGGRRFGRLGPPPPPLRQSAGERDKMVAVRQSLPAWTLRQTILDTIAGNDVTIVRGMTGSGTLGKWSYLAHVGCLRVKVRVFRASSTFCFVLVGCY